MDTGWGTIAFGYLLGSIPAGYLAGRMAGIDIREHGSGSTGATNVWRTLGKGYGIPVFAFDVLKGTVAVWLATWLASPGAWSAWFAVGAGLAAILGHSLPVWIGWRGGKSVATGLGVLLALDWRVAIAAFGTWLLSMAISRTVSLSSILAAIAAPLLMAVARAPLPYLLFALAGGAYVIWRHRANIARLLTGTEPTVSFGTKANTAETDG